MTAPALATPSLQSGVLATSPTDVIYPDSDGNPMADNTRQFD